MKSVITILNVLSGVSVLVAILVSYGAAMGSAFSANSTASSNKFLVFIVIGYVLLVILSIVLSHKKIGAQAFFWAFLPFIPWIVGMFLIKSFSIVLKRSNDAAFEQRLSQKLSRDYVYNVSDGGEMFITVDNEAHVMVLTSILNTSNIDTTLVGKIEGNTLKLFNDRKYRNFYNADNKTLYDVYDVVYVPGQSTEEYNMEKYRFDPGQDL